LCRVTKTTGRGLNGKGYELPDMRRTARGKMDTRHRAGGFLVWVECTECRTHTARYMDSGNPSEDSPGGKWAILAWNSGEHNTDRKKV